MASYGLTGARPRRSRSAAAAGIAAFGGFYLGLAGGLAAKSAGIEFEGQLNYDTFKRAVADNIGIRVTRSPGGTGAAAMVLGRVRGLVIDGPCNSACAWAFVQNENACFTKRASFGFHAAHDPGTGRRLSAATDYWLGTAEPELRSRLSGLRTSSNVIRISASEMTRYYGGRACGAGEEKSDAGTAKPSRDNSSRPRAEENAKPATAPVASWSASDVEAGSEALRIAGEDGGVIVATLIASDLPQFSAATQEAQTAESLAERVAPTTEMWSHAEGRWPTPARTIWDGLAVSGREADLARSDASAVDG